MTLDAEALRAAAEAVRAAQRDAAPREESADGLIGRLLAAAEEVRRELDPERLGRACAPVIDRELMRLAKGRRWG